ncbi:MAG: SMP-30/gluconolactonase/LRE family protein, partial [Verrucomicrobiota bacterium]
MKTIEATQLPIRALDHGEGACWWAERQALLWVDIHCGEVHLYDPVTGEDRMWKAPSHVGFAHPTKRGDLILGIKDGIARLNLDSGAITKLVNPEAKLGDTTRMNDGKPGPDGRLYAGTMAYSEQEPIGSLWRIEKDFSYTRVIDGVTVSNGLCWSADGGTFY